MNLGDGILYLISALGITAIILLIINQLVGGKKDVDTPPGRLVDFFSDIDVPLKWLIRILSLLLIFDLSLLTYYFLTTNLAINYVWTFSSKDLPIVYKLSGVMAGQQGTLLFWGVFIGLSSLWLSERRDNTDFVKKTQIVLISLCLIFIGLTLTESPFETIYQLYPDDISESYVPSDGSGLNPLLIDPWMAVHPPIIFVAYAAMAAPFALALAYLFKSLKGTSKKVYEEWIKDVTTWCRISWIFLTLGIAIGGFWAYKVLGWGGFWAWDPVETSSLVPWFLLTGALHALAEHRKDRSKYDILAPLLVSLSFTLVLYATLVTRSGFFESVHAFDAGGTGRYILVMTIISALVPLTLAIVNSMRAEEPEEKHEEKITFINRTNMFYTAVVIFIIFTFVSFWGITFPAISKLVSKTKIGIGPAFYNIWSYPVIIGAMLLAGLALSYRPSKKEKCIREFLLFLGMTVVVGFIKPSEAWNLLSYSPTMGLGSTTPPIYSFIGSISILSFIPPSVYLVYSSIGRFRTRLGSPKKEYVAKALGISVIHVGVALIVVGSVFSYALDSEFPVSINSGEEGKLTPVPGSPYGVKLLKYETLYEYKDVEKSYPGISIGEFYDEIYSGIKDSYTVHGDVGEVMQTQHNTYIKLIDGDRELWIATTLADIPEGSHVAATGIINLDFRSSFFNRTFSVLLLAEDFEIFSEEETISTTQQVKIAVYEGRNEIARGAAKHVTYFNGDAWRVMIDRSIKGDVYVILNGISGRSISLDLRIKPLINLVWTGVIFFTFGMIAVLLSDLIPKKRKK